MEVTITNNNTGHHVPTGVTIRNMILLIEAFTKQDSTPLTILEISSFMNLVVLVTLSRDIMQDLPVKFYSKVNHDSSGNGPTFFTDATGIIFDNRIPALDTDTTNYAFELPGAGEDYFIRARLIYRRSFRFLVDAKQWEYDGHNNPLEDILPPYFGHLMEEEVWESSTSSVSDIELVNFSLEQNYPNPFNPETEIIYQLQSSADVELVIYNSLGEKIISLINEYQEAGSYKVKWLGTDEFDNKVSSGVYLYRFKAGDLLETKKMVLLR